MQPFNEQELKEFIDKLAAITETGTEAQVRAFVDSQFPRLPEEMKIEIAARVFADSINAEAQELETLEDIQNEELGAVEELEEIKKEAESQPLDK